MKPIPGVAEFNLEHHDKQRANTWQRLLGSHAPDIIKQAYKDAKKGLHKKKKQTRNPKGE